jgi:hypothetical protein
LCKPPQTYQTFEIERLGEREGKVEEDKKVEVYGKFGVL